MYEVALQRTIPDALLRRIAAALVIASSLLVIGTVFTEPVVRYVLRVGLRSLFMGGVFLWMAGKLARMGFARSRKGRWLILGLFALFGPFELHNTGVQVAWSFFQLGPPPYWDFHGIFDLLAIGILSMATLLWLLEVEWARAEVSEEARSVSEAKYRMILDNALVGIGRSTRNGRLLEANEKLAEIFGYDSVEHYIADYEPIKHYTADGAREKLLALLERDGSVDRYETPVTRRDGSQLWMRITARLNRDEGYLDFAIEDITREREAEARQAILRVQLSQSQKMEAVGKLTGGVAHDFNNLLTIILGNLELLLHKTKDPKVVEMAKSAVAAADRAAALTQSLLAFSRKQPLQSHRVNLANTLAGMEDLLVRSLGERIEISVRSADDLSDCYVDPSRLENAILNLTINARDAMAEGGHLTIEVSIKTLSDGHPSGLDAGEYVCLTVSDSGVGMSAEVVRSAFDPFFTTKDIGQGTGLGLSMVYGFAKQSGGHVSIDSQIGEGTSVRLYLPVADVDAAPESPRAPKTEAPHGDGEIILVVEDDEGVLDVTVSYLTRLGYQAVPVASAAGALGTLEGRDDIDVLLTDVVLPGAMSGGDLAREVRGTWPGIRVLYMSGYTDDVVLQQVRPGSDVDLLEKPFGMDTLAQKLGKVLAPIDTRDTR